MEKEIIPFGIKDQLGYVAGDMAGSFVNLYFDAYFLLFCTYVLGMDPKFMGGMFLFARLFDAINDPIIGSFPDRWRIGKSGDKFKPYIKIAMWPLALSAILGFLDVSSQSDTFKTIWVTFVYILYGVAYTGTSMPFGSMASVVTNDPIERTKLSSARAIGGMTVGFGFLSFVPMFIWDSNKNPVAQGYLNVGIVFAILSIISYFVLCNFTQERVRTPKTEEAKKFDYIAVLKGAFKNRPLLGIMFASIGSLIFITGNSQFGSFVYKEYYKMPKAIQIGMFATIPITFILLPIIPKLSKKYGKRKVLLISLFINLFFSTFLFLVPLKNVYTYVTLYTLGTIGQFVFTMLVWAFVTDSIDYNEYMTGERNDGSLYSIHTFSRKIGSTIASSSIGFILAAIGFVPKAAEQAPAVIENIRRLGTGVPLIAVILEIIGIALIYNLNQEKTAEMYEALSKKRAKA